MKLKRKYKILFSLIIIISIVILSIIGYYKYSLSKVSNNNEVKIVEIKQGSNSIEIGKILKQNNLIRNDKTFAFYVKLNKINNLKYGTYKFSENMGVKKIVRNLIDGSKYNPDEVKLTIKEGINMRQIATEISKVTDNSYDDVINKANDMTYINSIKEKYWFITDDLDNNDLFYRLEGYLYPETYSLSNKEVSVEYIFNKMLDEMDKKLAPYKDIESSLSIHQILTLASMIEKESATDIDRKSISSVFLNRIKVNMTLGSDVTSRYANKIDNPKRVLTAKEYQINNKYNTRLADGSMNGKLPIGPISTVSLQSIEAAIYPDINDYIYFIANINTKETFFYNNYTDFLKKKNELQEVNGGF